MPRIFVQAFEVPASAIDVNGHVSNLAYLQWMQDGAIAHSAAQGWPLERYLAIGAGWVVRSHFIEYLLPAFEGERLRLVTWVAGVHRHRSSREFRFWRERDRQVIARAETVWVFVDAATGRPTQVPPELASAFEIVPEGEDVLAALHPDAGGAFPEPPSR